MSNGCLSKMRRDAYRNTTTHIYHLFLAHCNDSQGCFNLSTMTVQKNRARCPLPKGRHWLNSTTHSAPRRFGGAVKGHGNQLYLLVSAIYTSTFFQYTCRPYLKVSFSMITTSTTTSHIPMSRFVTMTHP